MLAKKLEQEETEAQQKVASEHTPIAAPKQEAKPDPEPAKAQGDGLQEKMAQILQMKPTKPDPVV